MRQCHVTCNILKQILLKYNYLLVWGKRAAPVLDHGVSVPQKYMNHGFPQQLPVHPLQTILPVYSGHNAESAGRHEK